MTERLDSNNGYTALRLAAAFSVILTHSYVLLGLKEDWLAARGFPQFSEIGVAAFFALSGFLVCRSLQRNPAPFIYLRNRALRLLPGLAVLMLVTVFVVAPLLTHEWHADWLSYFCNLSLFKATPYLSGVFAENPVQVVNGSLWTLPLEVVCYLMLLGLSWSGALNWRGTLLVFATFGAMLFGGMLQASNYFMGFDTFQLVRVGLFFWGGAFLATVNLPRSWLLWSCTVIAAALPYFLLDRTYDWHYREVAYYLLLPFIVNFVAIRLSALSFLDRFDFSYGIYIYAFVVQQVIVARYGAGMHPVTLSALSVAATTPIAAASWFLVERPALALKNRRRYASIPHPYP